MIASRKKNILITGSQGFIAKNLIINLKQGLTNYKILEFNKKHSIRDLSKLVAESNYIVHLAGENRPKSKDLFKKNNTKLTFQLCKEVDKVYKRSKKHIPIIFSSSIHALSNSLYGNTKLEAENHLKDLNQRTNNPVIILRLPGVFGKWGIPNYNSVVSTFCHNIANNLPITMDEPKKKIKLVYIDDVVNHLIYLLKTPFIGIEFQTVNPQFNVSLGFLAKTIHNFHKTRKSLLVQDVGSGFKRALYATYLSYLKPAQFTYTIPNHNDTRGNFVEMLKTKNSGQISFFTSKPGIERGMHFHNTKNEKFLVVKGKALFKNRHIITNQRNEIVLDSRDLRIIDTIPGWAHSIKNIGKSELIVMLWANEIFDPNAPDTFASKI